MINSQVVIYHNPRCSKSRATLKILQDHGIQPKIVEYLKTPLNGEEINELLVMLNISPRNLLRKGEDVYKLLNLKNKGKSMPWSITEIHPLLVHFPIALFSTGLLFDISSYFLEKEELETAGFYTMFMGLISSFFAIISGMIAFFVIGSIDSHSFKVITITV